MKRFNNNKSSIYKKWDSNSEIKYEYYVDGIHSSYPDFILKAKSGRIHIFEVNSLNKSRSFDINLEEYFNKTLNLLEKCYKNVSKLTEYNFYIQIREKGEWRVRWVHNGIVEPNQIYIEDLKKEIIDKRITDRREYKAIKSLYVTELLSRAKTFYKK